MNILLLYARINTYSSIRGVFNTSEDRLTEKIDYALTILEQIEVPTAKFVKKLQNSIFYELRISTNNEYRVLLFPLDAFNLIESKRVLVLQGFLKKSNKDYTKQIAAAEKIIDDLL